MKKGNCIVQYNTLGGEEHIKVINHHHHKGLDTLIRSVSRVTAVIFFLVVCSCMILEGFGFVAFCVCVKASSVCIRLSCLVCL
jgi:hypothetical protein